MKIDLRKLAYSDTIPFSGTADLSDETLYGAKPFQSPVTYSGTVTNQLDVLRLTGEVKTTYHTCCARCLKPLQIPLSADVDVVLSRNAADEGEEEEVFHIEGNEFEAEDIFVPALILQVDMIYLCRQDCKGLCPSCGCNLNESVCSCGSKQADQRMAVLAKLLEGNEGRQD